MLLSYSKTNHKMPFNIRVFL